MSTLTNGVTTVTLSDDLQWVDEFAWHPVVQKTGRTITGAYWVDAQPLTAGRPITLQGDEQTGWVRRADLVLLQALAVSPSAVSLTLRGVTYPVIFDHEAVPIEARAVVGFDDVAPTDFYNITVRLRTTA
jgi:hypothetical protein